METVRYHVALRWYLRYQLDEPVPDHSSLLRIRERLGLPLFERFFDHVVELCQQAGLVWGKELFFDGTKVQANAAMGSLCSHWSAQARAYLDDLIAGDATGRPNAYSGSITTGRSLPSGHLHRLGYEYPVSQRAV